ncbi:MAG: 4-hydroxythreonine-4-phosphate dehydrogenase PdxA [Planctomycetota bacterium]
MKLPRVAISMGDPAGIGPELCLKVISNPRILATCVPVIVGDAKLLTRVAQKMGQSSHAEKLTGESLFDGGVRILDGSSLNLDRVNPGEISQISGQASFDFVATAIEAAKSGTVDAVVTCPIHKESWQLAGIKYPGHTELFAAENGTNRFCMMMTAPAFSCSLVTTHVGYREVPELITPSRIVEVGMLTHSALTKILGRKPKLTMLGLNPHAGENGLFGNQEEELSIGPAVEILVSRGIEIDGPIPADTAFLPAKRQLTDGYICMYHDQGLIPFKAFNFDTGVNVTLGLEKMIRTSVDHGTAMNIAWHGIADESSLVSAIELATKLASSGTELNPENNLK